MLHKETVEASTLDLIHRLMADDDLKEFNLVGGTAIALMFGHRISVYIDLFTNNPFDSQRLGALLSAKYKIDNLETDNNNINCFIEDIKVDCIAHCYPWIQPAVFIEGIRMASIEDIPDEQLRMVRDYLLCALNMDSVEPALASRLEKLRVSLDDALQR